jgi:hypothetical protein
VRSVLAGLLLSLLVSGAANAQTAEPVSGYVIDLRGVMTGLPKETAFFPGLPADTVVPARGFGFDVGAHVYLLSLGPSRLGVGANYIRGRGTVPGMVSTFSTVAPQVSFNFGSRAGWSYLSAGFGRASVETTLESEEGTTHHDADGLNALNFGGGARWFLAARLAVGFDVRFNRVSGDAKATLTSLSVGFSVR